MKVPMTSPNGSATRIALQAFADEARTGCARENLVPLPDQGSVRMVGDTSQQMIADAAILHPYTDQPPGAAAVIADCNSFLTGLERFSGNDAAEIRASVSKHCSTMNKVSLLSLAGGAALGTGLYLSGLGWVGAGLGLATAIGGVAFAETKKSGAHDFESKLNAWDQAIQTGNPHRLPIPAEGAVSFEYVFMVEKGYINVSRSYRIPGSLLNAPTSWTGQAPQSGPGRTIVPPENVATGSLASKPARPRGRFDGPNPLWPVTDVKIPEPVAETNRMAEVLDGPKGPAVQEAGGRVMVGGVAVRKRRQPAAEAETPPATAPAPTTGASTGQPLTATAPTTGAASGQSAP